MHFDPAIYEQGWLTLGFASDFTEPMTPVTLGRYRLMVVKRDEGLKVYDANCPHRGAHLAIAGKLEGCDVVCGFHNYRIGLGESSERGLRVTEYRTLLLDGVLFARLSTHAADPFESFITELHQTHRLMPGFQMPVNTTPDLVIENGFDNRHFHAVHKVSNDPKFEITTGRYGEIVVSSEFVVPPQQKVGYECHTFSPCLTVVHFASPTQPYYVITGATPTADYRTTIHISIAFSRAIYGPNGPDARFVEYLLRYSRMGLEDDRVMWESLQPGFAPKYMPADDAMRYWHDFCAGFLERVPA